MKECDMAGIVSYQVGRGLRSMLNKVEREMRLELEDATEEILRKGRVSPAVWEVLGMVMAAHAGVGLALESLEAFMAALRDSPFVVPEPEVLDDQAIVPKKRDVSEN